MISLVNKSILSVIAVGFLVIGSAAAQTQTAAPKPPKPLSAFEATQCRAVAEGVRDHAYDDMRTLLMRVERTPNLTLEALTEVQGQIASLEATIKASEHTATRFAFAAEPSKAARDKIMAGERAELTPRLETCVSRLPPEAKTSDQAQK